jgi:hypothetical protein
MIAIQPMTSPGRAIPAPVVLKMANLSEVERALVATLVATLCDPALAPMKRLLLAGKVSIGVTEGEVGLIHPLTPS